MSADLAPWIAIAVAAGVTFGTRTLGPVIMARVPETKRVQRFLDSLSTSVIVAIVAGFLARGTLREAAALAAGALVMMLFQKPMLSMSTAMVVAAVWSSYPP
ncbi:MAG: AzlD domain-containing protein [Reyranella sp.]|nr:AzlD domain-containing protein [Reyranella sp.]MDP3163554.1 AzlD domain-containing protein [Reyranella sp.]